MFPADFAHSFRPVEKWLYLNANQFLKYCGLDGSMLNTKFDHLAYFSARDLLMWMHEIENVIC